MRFAYYEEGGRKIFTMSKLYRRYTVDIHPAEKLEGSTCVAWLYDMVSYQILNPVYEKTLSEKSLRNEAFFHNM